MNRSPVPWKGLLWLAALAVWSFFLWRAVGTYAPRTDVNNVGYNSDSAIPVLMSNETRPLGAYRLYYYGADRWGAWPMLVTRGIGAATGHRWTDGSFFAVQALWVFLGAIVFASLTREGRIAAGLFYLIPLCLNRDGRLLMFELSQIYGWQATGVLLGWLGFRRLHRAYVEDTQTAPVWRRLAWLLATFVSAYLAIWSSIASAIFLVFLLHLELARGCLIGRTAQPGRPVRPWLRVLTPYVLGAGALAAAWFVEHEQKLAYRDYAARHWGNPVSAYFFVDRGYLWENVLTQVQHLAQISWLPLYVVPLLALVALAAALGYALFTKREDLRARISAVLVSDLAVLAIGAYGLAAINLALAVVVSHVRMNEYDSRYLTLTNLFAPLAGLLTLYLLTTLVVRAPRVRRYLQPAFVLPALVVLAAQFPTVRTSAEYTLMEETALTLARRAPGGVLLGGYWETYLFASLQPRDAMTPVPFEGPFNVTPWTRDTVRAAREVVVGYPRPGGNTDVPMPPTLAQYGCTLRLVEPHWYGNYRWAFALYANDCRRPR